MVTSKKTGPDDLLTERFLLKRMSSLRLALGTYEWTRNEELFRHLQLRPVNRGFRRWFRYIRKLNGKRMLSRAIIDRASGKLIGVVTLALDSSSGIAEAGIIIGDTNWHGTGTNQEVTAACIDDCFGRLGLYKVRCRISGRNVASIKGYLSLGFRPEGVARGEFVGGDGRRSDFIHFGLFREEWESAAG